DPEAPHGLRVPVGEEADVEVERLHPRDVRPRRVSRDAEAADAGGLELGSPVTQELELVRSRRGPVEEVEEQEDRAVLDDLPHRHGLARAEPDGRAERDRVAGPEHQAPTSFATTVWSYVLTVSVRPCNAIRSGAFGRSSRARTWPLRRSSAYR